MANIQILKISHYYLWCQVVLPNIIVLSDWDTHNCYIDGEKKESGDSVKLEIENAGLFLNRFLYYGTSEIL